MRIEPDFEDWKELFKAAVDFRDIECWKWMYDTNVFGVENPDNGEIGYCTVLGNLGEVFSLNVYLGDRGLRDYLGMLNRPYSSEEQDKMLVQNCLMASFENRNDLSARDLKVIKELGLTFRGRKKWPYFRRFKPGHPPWYLTKGEAEFLTIALQQSKKVAFMCKEKRDSLKPPDKNMVFVMVSKGKGKNLHWYESWMKPELIPEEFMVPIIDDSYLSSIRNSIDVRRGEWEIDCFYAPIMIKEKKDEIPYYPFISLFVEHSKGFIIDFQLSRHSEYTEKLHEKFISLILYNKIIPLKILVRNDETYLPLEQIAEQLDIKLQLVKNLKYIESARKELCKRFM
jgi:hypothetical protein